MTRNRPPGVEEARLINHPDPRRREYLLDKLIRYLLDLQDFADSQDPGGAIGGGNTTTNSTTITVEGGAGGVVIPSSGVSVGQLVSIWNGSPRSCGYDTRAATHCVGEIQGSVAICYRSWASGPVRLYGDGTLEEVYLGLNDRATLAAPPPSTSPTPFTIQQVIGRRLEGTTSGLVSCSLNIQADFKEI